MGYSIRLLWVYVIINYFPIKLLLIDFDNFTILDNILML